MPSSSPTGWDGNSIKGHKLRLGRFAGMIRLPGCAVSILVLALDSRPLRSLFGVGGIGKVASSAMRFGRKSILSQARMRLKLYPAAVRIAFAASPARPLR